MAGPSRDGALDHVVVLAFENRSFDNLLGRLYQPGEVASFEGVIGKRPHQPHPVVGRARRRAQGRPLRGAGQHGHSQPRPGGGVPARQHPAVRDRRPRGQPVPDRRRHGGALQRTPVVTAGADHGRLRHRLRQRLHLGDRAASHLRRVRPDHDGLHPRADAGHARRWPVGSPPSTTGSARCRPRPSPIARSSTPPRRRVSSSTPTRRTRSRSATPRRRCSIASSPEGLTWRVYCDPPSHLSFTGLVHAARLYPRFGQNFVTTDQFLADAEAGALPTYSFVEPNMWHGHNDMHPAFNSLLPGDRRARVAHRRGGSPGQDLRAVRSSSSPTGSNAYNTLLLVAFDEHGGTYDHVPPPPVAPPDPSAPPVSSASASTGPGCGSRPWPSRPGSPGAPSSPTSTATPVRGAVPGADAGWGEESSACRGLVEAAHCRVEGDGIVEGMSISGGTGPGPGGHRGPGDRPHHTGATRRGDPARPGWHRGIHGVLGRAHRQVHPRRRGRVPLGTDGLCDDTLVTSLRR